MQTNKPFYKKWWFWILTVIVILTANIFRSSSESAASHPAEPRSAQVKQKSTAVSKTKSKQLAAKKKEQTKRLKQLAAKKQRERKKQQRLGAQKRQRKQRQKAEQKRLAAIRQQKQKQLKLQKKQRRQQQRKQQKAQKEQAAASDHHSRTVYVAPTSGRRYHFSPNCRGLRPANGNITKMTLQQAINQGYTLCKWED